MLKCNVSAIPHLFLLEYIRREIVSRHKRQRRELTAFSIRRGVISTTDFSRKAYAGATQIKLDFGPKNIRPKFSGRFDSNRLTLMAANVFWLVTKLEFVCSAKIDLFPSGSVFLFSLIS